ncbi:phenylacetate--CoA ligase [Actinomadura sp. NBRC 104425]|uniref:phenylacetate--CoA ligase family protein n=1 Tax=Actinomadura sp. NBRC 104425 TaxID=3032204 RepID=UPI0024A4B371|nr:phenylacetate--CoA ligase family protein [Actinomadura sp. NBRC 104425]GLZ10759.1 phenylacetate--CoA ligase [Actinomadura sp. NBRC 104425]
MAREDAGARLSPRLGPLTPRERWRRARLQACSWLLTGVYRSAAAHPAVWRFTARRYHPALDRLAARHARLACAFAAVDVPAYRDFVRRTCARRPRRLADFPETSKQNYASVYDEASRCQEGRLHRPGVIVDESSGSTGKPYNWVRGPRELKGIYRNAAGYIELVFPGRRLFVINAYSMGAWATGTTTGAALARIAMVKNTGPDLDKIVDTLEHFGPGYDYIVAAYPPFLKHLVDRLDALGFPWKEYRIRGMVGGEGMTEALRDYLERRLEEVRSGYGASDLTIGMGAESAFTVWLRKRLAVDAELRRELLGEHEQRLPMIFHYNPLETYLEVNARGELLCTLTSKACLQPKLRYNVGDEALLHPLHRVRKIIRRDPQRWAECRRATGDEKMTLPLLFLFGRADSTISYMGANLYPQDVEYGLYEGNPYAADIARFCLSLEEQPDLESRPVVNIELREDADMDETAVARLARICRDGVRDHLAAVSRDFAASLKEDPAAGDLRVRVFGPGEGPFAGAGGLKNVYLVKDAPAADAGRHARAC